MGSYDKIKPFCKFIFMHWGLDCSTESTGVTSEGNHCLQFLLQQQTITAPNIQRPAFLHTNIARICIQFSYIFILYIHTRFKTNNNLVLMQNLKYFFIVLDLICGGIYYFFLIIFDILTLFSIDCDFKINDNNI